MSPVNLLIWLQTSWFAHAIAESNHMLVACLQVVHVFGFIFLLAPLFLVGLRIFRCVLGAYALEHVIRQARRLSLIGLSMTLGSGILMFLSAPLHYYFNWAFDAKMLLLLFAITLYVAQFLWLALLDARHPVLARVSVSLSLLSWIAVCMAGRAIGFV
jgi:hypothetical protein